MDEEARQRAERRNLLTQREMYRKSRDVIRVYNPLNETFRFYWDGFPQSVPAKSTKDMERYLANHYFKYISQRIIGDLIIKRGNELLTKHKKSTGSDYLDKYTENREIWDKTPKLDDPELLASIHKDVILGLVEEYGMDFPEDIEQQPVADTRDIYTKILDAGERRVSDDVPEPVQPEPRPLRQAPQSRKPQNDNNRPNADEITQNE